jgi:hypothetical protein
MANALVTSQIITNEVLRIAHNASAFLGNMNTDYKESWNGEYKPGTTVKARGPVQFTHRTGETANVQDITERSVDVTLQPLLGLDFAVGSTELATSIGNDGKVDKAFKERYLKPAGLKLAAILDYSVGTILKNGAHQIVGTPGTPPATFADLLQRWQVPLDRMSVPRDGKRMAAIEPGANASIVAGLAACSTTRSVLGEQYKTGVIKTGAGLDIAMSQNVPSHTVGALGGTPLVNGANQGTDQRRLDRQPLRATTSLVTDGWTAAAAAQRLNQGDTFTIAGVFSVNPETKASTGVLQSFLVTADAPRTARATADGRDLPGDHRWRRLPERDGSPGRQRRDHDHLRRGEHDLQPEHGLAQGRHHVRLAQAGTAGRHGHGLPGFAGRRGRCVAALRARLRHHQQQVHQPLRHPLGCRCHAAELRRSPHQLIAAASSRGWLSQGAGPFCFERSQGEKPCTR